MKRAALAGLLALALALALTGCKPAPQPPAKPPPTVAQPAASEPLLVGVFAGDLLCADCPGLATRLTLVRKDPTWAEGRYLLVQTYRERDMPPLVTTGEWTTLRGDADDPDASVYQLDPDKPNRSQMFRKEGDDRIRALTLEMRPFPASLPQTLTRQTADLPGDAAINCLRGGGVPQVGGVCAASKPLGHSAPE